MNVKILEVSFLYDFSSKTSGGADGFIARNDGDCRPYGDEIRRKPRLSIERNDWNIPSVQINNRTSAT